jgi:hypothetical protein
MNALLDLEPRIAGEDISDPDADFTEHRRDLHYDANPDLYNTGTTTWGCQLMTHHCACV